MAFSLKNLPKVKEIRKSNNETKRQEIKQCYAIIKNQDKCTDNIKKALTTYLTERLEKLSTVNLSSDLLKSNIIELLEYCCDKDYCDIEAQDVIKNEKEILQQIMWCIEYENTKKLVWKEEENLDSSQFSTSLERKRLVTDIDLNELLDYFEIS